MARYRVTASSLNVRAGPSVEEAVVGWLKEHAVVERLASSGDGYWLRVRKGRLEGWCSHKYLSPVVDGPLAPSFPWMAIASSEQGTAERPGDLENPRILEYLHSTSLAAPARTRDETPWCSAFVNWCVERSGFEGTDSAWARSWLTWGKPLPAPVPGCVVVLSRGDGAGHVGFFVGRTRTGVKLLGGNQGNRVCVSSYPASRVLGYRGPGRKRPA